MAGLLSEKTIGDVQNKLNYEALLYYHKGNVIQAPLEALLSLYFAGIFIVFIGWFYPIPLSATRMMPLVFIPLLVGFIVCVVYTWFVSKSITTNLLAFSMEEAEQQKCDQSTEKKVLTLDKRMRQASMKIHISGAACYTGGAFIVSLLLMWKTSLTWHIIPTLTTIGLILGVAWNFLGFWGDQLVDWSKLVKDSPSTPINHQVKLKYYNRHLIINLAVLLGIIIFAGAVLVIADFDAEPRFTNETIVSEAQVNDTEDTSSTITDSWDIQTYYLIISLFMAVILVYTKQIASHFYFLPKDKSIPNVYWTINDYVPEKENEKGTQTTNADT